MERGAKRLFVTGWGHKGPEAALTVLESLEMRGTFLKTRDNVLLRSHGRFGAIHLRGIALPASVLIACAVAMLCLPLPAFAAERTVLCEEFTQLG